MRVLMVVSFALLAACASTKDAGPYPDAQAVVDRVAARHPDLVRLTLHAVPRDATECTQLASTVPERRGKRSDPEDFDALRNNTQIVLDEPGAIDVTIPILTEGGRPKAVAGVTLPAGEGANRGALVSRARAIAAELATEVTAAGKPLW